MTYWRNSFVSPLPWAGRAPDFYAEVVANPPPIAGELSASGNSVLSYTQYPNIAFIGETVGWSVFTFFLVFISIFRGVGMTGRVVYFTMGMPIVITIILVGRACSLPNAIDGVRLFVGTWRGEQLANGRIWQTACSQVFFSIGVGFGYFTSYASYSSRFSNVVVDGLLIAGSNVLFENFAAFAVFGVVGFLQLFPEPGAPPLGAFTVGFLTLPEAVAQLPGANFWAFALFTTLMTLGYSSAFAMLDAVVTAILDTGRVQNRTLVVAACVLVSFCFSLPYCTQFGEALLTGVDRWVSDVALVFVVFCEVTLSTSVYRYRDVIAEVGLPAFASYNTGYFGGMICGVTVAHTVSPAAGAGVGFGLYVLGSLAAMILGKTPLSRPPSFWGKYVWLERFWYVAAYQGNQLRRDLNRIVATGKNWSIPPFWGPLLRYVSGPVLAIVYSFSYPSFYQLRYDPLHILGFALGHISIVVIVLCFSMPRWFDVFVPPERRDESTLPTVPHAQHPALHALEERELEEQREQQKQAASDGQSSVEEKPEGSKVEDDKSETSKTGEQAQQPRVEVVPVSPDESPVKT
jgi:solute carrier family 6 GABA transporter-like protein 1